MKVNRIVLIILFSIFSTNLAYSQQEECASAIQKAKNYWDSNYYDDAIDLLTECLPNIADKAPAYELLALAYFSKEFQEPAKNTLAILFQLDPDYEMQFGTQEVGFVKFVEGVRKPKKSGSKKFLWIGIGAAAIGGGLVVALTGGGGPGTPTNVLPDLPEPPDDPARN